MTRRTRCGLVAGYYPLLDILSEGRVYIQQAPWLVLYPGGAIMLTILG